MHPSSRTLNQQGFSIMELIVAVSVMLIVAGAVFTLMKNSMDVSATTYELTDAQESLRIAQEYINRDLMNAGDGLSDITRIQVPDTFASNYLTLSPVTDPSTPGILNLAILTSDNNVTANTSVLGTSPVVTVRSNPVLTDRLTIMEVDPSFTPITLPANSSINLLGNNVLVSPLDIGRFTAGEVYFFTSSVGATFGSITSIIPGLSPVLVFGADPYGLNIPGIGGQLNTISGGGTLQTSLMRMRIIHYFVNSNGLLIRRVFGVKGAGFTDSVIAEHVVSLQFRYFLNLRDANGNVIQPIAQLTDSTQQLAVRQVETTVTTETPHAIQNGSRQQLTMTTSTSLRNVQYRENCRNSLC